MAQSDVLKRYLDAGMAFTQMTRSRAEGIVRELVRAGDVRRERTQETVDELIERSRRNTEALLGLVRKEVSAQLSQLGLVTKLDLSKLERRLGLRARAAPAKKRAAGSPTKKTVAKKAAAKKTAAKNDPTKKAAGKKAAGKKSSAGSGVGAAPTTASTAGPASTAASSGVTTAAPPGPAGGPQPSPTEPVVGTGSAPRFGFGSPLGLAEPPPSAGVEPPSTAGPADQG
jgi:polyhydroxyalkanoate synthesis regulator phasin